MTNRIPPRAIDASGYVGDGAQALHDDGTWKAPAAGSGGGASTLDDLIDVDTITTPPTAGQVLKFNGTLWTPGADSTGSGGGGSGSGYPPGSADEPPAVANAHDDEFDGSSTVTWTTTPTAPNAMDTNATRPHHLFVKASGSGAALVGRYQPAPTTYPYTIETKTSSTARANYHKAGGVLLTPAAPTGTSQAVYVGPQHNGGFSWARGLYNNFGTTFSSQSSFLGLGIGRDCYTRVVVNSATSISCYASVDGYGWALIENFSLPFSIANIGLACTEEGAGGGVEAFFDFFRVS